MTNIGRLTELEWLRGLSLQETAAAVTPSQTRTAAPAGAALWRDDTGVAQKQLKAALFSVDQGYAIRSVEYYQITGLTGSKATVTYNSGSGAERSRCWRTGICIRSWRGWQGDACKSCTIENATQRISFSNPFDFGIPEGSDGESHIYAFISASPATLLDEMGIYLGTKLEDGHWIAMDGPDEATATLRSTSSLQEL